MNWQYRIAESMHNQRVLIMKPKVLINRQVIQLLVVLALIGGAIFAIQKYKRSRTEKILTRTCIELNRDLPMMIDSVMRWDHTFSGPGARLNYKITLIGMQSDHVNIKTIRDAIEPKIVQDYRSNPKLQRLRDMSVILNYQYYDNSGVFLLNIEVDPGEL